MLMLKADKIDYQHDCDNREKDEIQPECTNGFHVNSPHRTTSHKKTLTSCQMKNIYNNMIKVLPTSYCSTFYIKCDFKMLRYRLFAKCADDILTRLTIEISFLNAWRRLLPLFKLNFI